MIIVRLCYDTGSSCDEDEIHMCVLPVVCLLQQCPPWVGWLVQPQFPWVGWAVHTCTPAMTKYFGRVEEFDPAKEDWTHYAEWVEHLENKVNGI